MQTLEPNAACVEVQPRRPVTEKPDLDASQRDAVETHWTRLLHCDLFASNDNGRSETSCTY